MGRWGDGEMGRSHRGRFFTLTSGVGYWVWGVGCGGTDKRCSGLTGVSPTRAKHG
ncbi:hypothetical protein [Moorena producens]|uniref:hypothetical protein n=1 Tax=Moorena producens TaxID=1155739 RepID=UPI003C73ED0B